MLIILLVLIGFGLLITIHELGHFLVARAFGVGIEKFSIGFGKPIWEIERGGTKYRIAAIPLGGYVKMSGENPDEAEDSQTSDPERSLQSKVWWKKALIVFAGPFANLLLGLLLFIMAMALPQKLEDLSPVIHQAQGKWAEVFAAGDSLISVNGKAVPGFNSFLVELSKSADNEITLLREGQISSISVPAVERDSLMRSLQPEVTTQIGEVFSGMPAWRAGLKTGDLILAVDSIAVTDWYDMRQRIASSTSSHVLLDIKRGEEFMQRKIELQDNLTEEDERMIGIMQYLPVKGTVQYSLLEALQYGTLSTISFIQMQYSGLFRLAKQPAELKNNLGGPVMIVSMSQEVGRRGLSSVLLFLASISLVLMIMNLLPIPILDGGHIMFYAIEGIIGKPVSLKVQGIAQRIGLVLLIWLMLFAFYADLSRLFSRFLSLR
ncbi:MAG TPA: RIP metalloprotease RseP [Candidatus Cloacimonadota bacterium]|nr:RIP metalloprotease RseP [Candidatus Cloacimonadota bacterium]HPF08305.1 RIP metalloprotease RseP [Candidatus Cloacimonadota bacterium]